MCINLRHGIDAGGSWLAERDECETISWGTERYVRYSIKTKFGVNVEQAKALRIWTFLHWSADLFCMISILNISFIKTSSSVKIVNIYIKTCKSSAYTSQNIKETWHDKSLFKKVITMR